MSTENFSSPGLNCIHSLSILCPIQLLMAGNDPIESQGLPTVLCLNQVLFSPLPRGVPDGPATKGGPTAGAANTAPL